MNDVLSQKFKLGIHAGGSMKVIVRKTIPLVEAHRIDSINDLT
ncbi:hypothetical protein Hanom_Chr07g00619571 [Helianthus anomalus]